MWLYDCARRLTMMNNVNITTPRMPFKVRPETRKKLRQFQLNYFFHFLFFSLCCCRLCCALCKEMNYPNYTLYFVLELFVVFLKVKSSSSSPYKRAKSKLFNFNTATKSLVKLFFFLWLWSQLPNRTRERFFSLLLCSRYEYKPLFGCGTVNVRERLVESFLKSCRRSHTSASKRQESCIENWFACLFADRWFNLSLLSLGCWLNGAVWVNIAPRVDKSLSQWD